MRDKDENEITVPQKSMFVLYVLYYNYICIKCFENVRDRVRKSTARTNAGGAVNRVENKKHIETTAFRVPVAVSRNTLHEMLVIIPRTRPLVHDRIFQPGRRRRREHERALDISEKRCSVVRRSDRCQTLVAFSTRDGCFYLFAPHSIANI